MSEQYSREHFEEWATQLVELSTKGASIEVIGRKVEEVFSSGCVHERALVIEHAREQSYGPTLRSFVTQIARGRHLERHIDREPPLDSAALPARKAPTEGLP